MKISSVDIGSRLKYIFILWSRVLTINAYLQLEPYSSKFIPNTLIALEFKSTIFLRYFQPKVDLEHSYPTILSIT